MQNIPPQSARTGNNSAGLLQLLQPLLEQATASATAASTQQTQQSSPAVAVTQAKSPPQQQQQQAGLLAQLQLAQSLLLPPRAAGTRLQPQSTISVDDTGDDGGSCAGSKRKRGAATSRRAVEVAAAALDYDEVNEYGKVQPRNLTGYIGVRQRKWGMFAAEIRDGDKRRWLGSFASGAEAGMAYDAAAISQKASKAKTNFRYRDFETAPRSGAETLDRVRWDFLPEDTLQDIQRTANMARGILPASGDDDALVAAARASGGSQPGVWQATAKRQRAVPQPKAQPKAAKGAKAPPPSTATAGTARTLAKEAAAAAAAVAEAERKAAAEAAQAAAHAARDAAVTAVTAATPPTSLPAMLPTAVMAKFALGLHSLPTSPTAPKDVKQSQHPMKQQHQQLQPASNKRAASASDSEPCDHQDQDDYDYTPTRHQHQRQQQQQQQRHDPHRQHDDMNAPQREMFGAAASAATAAHNLGDPRAHSQHHSSHQHRNQLQQGEVSSPDPARNGREHNSISPGEAYRLALEAQHAMTYGGRPGVPYGYGMPPGVAAYGHPGMAMYGPPAPGMYNPHEYDAGAEGKAPAAYYAHHGYPVPYSGEPGQSPQYAPPHYAHPAMYGYPPAHLQMPFGPYNPREYEMQEGAGGYPPAYRLRTTAGGSIDEKAAQLQEGLPSAHATAARDAPGRTSSACSVGATHDGSGGGGLGADREGGARAQSTGGLQTVRGGGSGCGVSVPGGLPHLHVSGPPPGAARLHMHPHGMYHPSMYGPPMAYDPEFGHPDAPPPHSMYASYGPPYPGSAYGPLPGPFPSYGLPVGYYNHPAYLHPHMLPPVGYPLDPANHYADYPPLQHGVSSPRLRPPLPQQSELPQQPSVAERGASIGGVGQDRAVAQIAAGPGTGCTFSASVAPQPDTAATAADDAVTPPAKRRPGAIGLDDSSRKGDSASQLAQQQHPAQHQVMQEEQAVVAHERYLRAQDEAYYHHQQRADYEAHAQWQQQQRELAVEGGRHVQHPGQGVEQDPHAPGSWVLASSGPPVASHMQSRAGHPGYECNLPNMPGEARTPLSSTASKAAQQAMQQRHSGESNDGLPASDPASGSAPAPDGSGSGPPGASRLSAPPHGISMHPTYTRPPPPYAFAPHPYGSYHPLVFPPYGHPPYGAPPPDAAHTNMRGAGPEGAVSPPTHVLYRGTPHTQPLPHGFVSPDANFSFGSSSSGGGMRWFDPAAYPPSAMPFHEHMGLALMHSTGTSGGGPALPAGDSMMSRLPGAGVAAGVALTAAAARSGKQPVTTGAGLPTPFRLPSECHSLLQSPSAAVTAMSSGGGTGGGGAAGKVSSAALGDVTPVPHPSSGGRGNGPTEAAQTAERRGGNPATHGHPQADHTPSHMHNPAPHAQHPASSISQHTGSTDPSPSRLHLPHHTPQLLPSGHAHGAHGGYSLHPYPAAPGYPPCDVGPIYAHGADPNANFRPTLLHSAPPHSMCPDGGPFLAPCMQTPFPSMHTPQLQPFSTPYLMTTTPSAGVGGCLSLMAPRPSFSSGHGLPSMADTPQPPDHSSAFQRYGSSPPADIGGGAAAPGVGVALTAALVPAPPSVDSTDKQHGNSAEGGSLMPNSQPPSSNSDERPGGGLSSHTKGQQAGFEASVPPPASAVGGRAAHQFVHSTTHASTSDGLQSALGSGAVAHADFYTRLSDLTASIAELKREQAAAGGALVAARQTTMDSLVAELQTLSQSMGLPMQDLGLSVDAKSGVEKHNAGQ